MGKASRSKGARREVQIVNLHKTSGIHAERVPLSGASRYQGNGADVDIYTRGRDHAPWVCEVKARASGEGFATIKRWLSDHDALFLIEDRATPLVVLPWPRWMELLNKRAPEYAPSPPAQDGQL